VIQNNKEKVMSVVDEIETSEQDFLKVKNAPDAKSI